jgi:ABC-2 type transport system permease protein
MNAPETAAGAADSAAPPATAAPLPVATVLYTLVRRELWEHRVLWLAPVAVAVLMIVLAAISGASAVHIDTGNMPDFVGAAASASHSRLQIAIFSIVHWLTCLLLFVVGALVLCFYLGDCLYAERKDRSILFWKSLPVSDLSTVISKVLVAFVLVPVGIYLLAGTTDLLLSFIRQLRSHLAGLGNLLAPWDTLAWLKVQGMLGIGLVFSILWYAPVGAYLLLVSAWARRNAFLWAVLPPALAPLLEYFTFGTQYLWRFLVYRTDGFIFWPELQTAMSHASVHFNNGSLLSMPELFDTLPVARLFTNMDLWLGVLAAVAAIWGAVRIRHYRDDS